MTVSVRYIGTSRPYFETGVTGKQTSWYPGQAAAVSDSDATLLLATGVFEYGETAGGKSANDNRTIQSYAAAVVGAAPSAAYRRKISPRGTVLMSAGDYPSMTISDNTNVTYSVVSDGVKILSSGAAVYGRIRLNTGRDIQIPGQKLACDVYVDPTHWAYNAARTAPNMNLYISPDDVTAGATNSLSMGVVNANMMPGWNRLSASLTGNANTEYAAWTVGGTVPRNGAVRYCYVDTTLAASGDQIIVRNLDIGERGRPVIMFGFDGAAFAAQALNQECIKYMIDRGVRGYIAVRTSQITGGNAPYLAAAYAAGFDILQQTNEDRNYSTYDAAYPTGAAMTALLMQRWSEADAILAARGWDRGRNVFSYPQNAFFSEGNTALLAAGVKMIRVARGTAKNSAPDGAMQTPYVSARDMGNTTYSASFQHWIRSNVDLGNVLMTYSHEIVSDGATPTSTQTKVTEFKRAVDLAVAYRDRGECELLSPSQFVGAYYS